MLDGWVGARKYRSTRLGGYSSCGKCVRRVAVNGTDYTTFMHILRDGALGHTAVVRDICSTCMHT